MANPFEDENGEYTVLANAQMQYSLWPGFLEVPVGWAAIGTRGKRRNCLDWIDRPGTASNRSPSKRDAAAT
jgi:MbtH protein